MMNLLKDKDMTNVNGGIVTPLGEFSAKDLIDMYIQEPEKAKQYISLAKRICPGLADEFRKECEENGLIIPEELDKLLG